MNTKINPYDPYIHFITNIEPKEAILFEQAAALLELEISITDNATDAYGNLLPDLREVAFTTPQPDEAYGLIEEVFEKLWEAAQEV